MTRTKARSCTGKVAHKTKADALEHFYSLKRKGAVGIHIYTCRFGPTPHRHVGHKSRKRR